MRKQGIKGGFACKKQNLRKAELLTDYCDIYLDFCKEMIYTIRALFSFNAELADRWNINKS